MIFLVGCQGADLGTSPTLTNIPLPSDTPPPPEVPTPTATLLPPVGLLLAPPEADSGLVEAVQILLAEWIPAAGYRFQVRPALTADDFSRDDFRLVVAVAPLPELASLVAGHPETRFLTLGIEGLESAPNLSVIGGDGDRLDQQGFVAGYMAALITPDWRVGVIGLSGSDETSAARQAFFAGVKFYCGLCLPVYPPFYVYPLFFELGPDADTTEWNAAAEYMIHRGVETVYVVPGAGDDSMLRHLAQSGVGIIGGTPPLADIQNQWVASLRFDPFQAFQSFWPSFAEGIDNQAVPVPMTLMDINPDLLSPGKQRLVEEILDDVLADYIDLGVNAAQNP